ncbi:MAG: asparagine--tRNA ligase [Eubacteriales bacterium]|nr:asparagine--tRNA ligase [Eubacteriales bacterium]
MKHTDIVDIFDGKIEIGSEVTVCGWVRTFRDSKTMAFLEVNDGTTFKHLQIVIDKETIKNNEFMRLGCSVKVVGTLVKSVVMQDSVEINATEIVMLGDCPADYPLQKKRCSMEFLRSMPHLRVRTNTFNAVFRVRSVVASCIHEFFQARHFVYVNTPLITASDCEGAGEVFKVTTIGYSTEYKSEEEYYKNDFFGQKAGLSVSGQLEGEVAAMAFGKIYTFGPSFRAENSNTPRHAAEFWHIEPEVAFAELPDIIELAEDLIKHILNTVLDKCIAELTFFDKFMEPGLIEKLRNVVSHKFGIVEYTDAIRMLKESGAKFVYPVEWGEDIQTEHEKYLTEVIFKKPVFVINYPKGIKSFYMKQNSDGKTVAATDLLVPGVGEIIGCSEREADMDKLLQAIEERGMCVKEYEDYIALRKFGSVPHSGFGLGFERILMYITGMSNIRDVILYPRTAGDIK